MILKVELLDKLEYINGQAYAGAMLGGDDAYCACMEIMKVTIKLISQIRGDLHE